MPANIINNIMDNDNTKKPKSFKDMNEQELQENYDFLSMLSKDLKKKVPLLQSLQLSKTEAQIISMGLEKLVKEEEQRSRETITETTEYLMKLKNKVDKLYS